MNLELFKKDDLQIRVAKDENNEPLFCLKDICDTLELTNISMVKEAINTEFDKGGKFNLTPLKTNGGMQNFIFVNESEVYFILMRSDKPKAKEFRLWITKEVLPSIRKNGNYMQKEFSKELYSLLNDLKQANCIKDKLKNENESLKDELIQNQRELLSFYKNKDLKKVSTAPLCQDEIDQIYALYDQGFNFSAIAAKINRSKSSVRNYCLRRR
ncbi:TPA: helix-turn-helix domain-containing protein [Campylobacter jejuni]|nr:helix-turn-helix domain-containing protein [Campylobacter jejuni]HDZ5089913.1 helix-turn-helix domain-containing protein [Campylobacter jejuni]HDZ5125859.1 helix-turn-helix domain-containing protein [Campylobacter jejuni]